MIIYLIRHGKSLANSLRLINGTKDDPLTDEGESQIKLLKLKLELMRISPTKFITTDWKRAQQSANYLWPNVNWAIEQRLGETNSGNAATLNIDQFNNLYPNFHNSPYNHFPNGESHVDLNSRVTNWLSLLHNNFCPDDKIAIVTHAGPISCIWQHIMGVGMDKFPAFLQPNASLSTITLNMSSETPLHKLNKFKFISFE